jgi:hypothetical protein
MQLDLTDEEAAALLTLLNRVIADDRYPLSPGSGCCAPSGRSFQTRRRSRHRRDRRLPKSGTRAERHVPADRASELPALRVES